MITFRLRNNHGNFIDTELKAGDWIASCDDVCEVVRILDDNTVEVYEILFEDENGDDLPDPDDFRRGDLLKVTRQELKHYRINK